jgi:tRNA(Ile)-lysidine synthase
VTNSPAATAEVRRAVRAALGAAPPPDVGVACSGGADSLALAAATAHVGAACGTAVHGLVVDHGLQPGSAAQADAAHAALAGLGVDARIAAVTVSEAGDGPEAAARRARYAALRDQSQALGGAPVLLGHTLDDQAETVLLGLGRGSGARSLAGMRAWDPPWCRPLLGVRRAVTRAACAEAGLEPWEDPHNADPRYTRVRLRREVLPLLEDVLAGGAAEALARTADLVRDDADALDAWAEAVLATLHPHHGLPAADSPHTGCKVLPVDALADLPKAVRTRVLRIWAAAQGAEPLTAERTAAVDALVTDWHGQAEVQLPGGLHVRRRSDRLTVCQNSTPTSTRS